MFHPFTACRLNLLDGTCKAGLLVWLAEIVSRHPHARHTQASRVPQIYPQPGRRRQRLSQSDAPACWITLGGKSVWILGGGVMPTDVVKHIKDCCQGTATTFATRTFGKLFLGGNADYNLTQARRQWLQGEGIRWREMTGDLRELERIGLLTEHEADYLRHTEGV